MSNSIGRRKQRSFTSGDLVYLITIAGQKFVGIILEHSRMDQIRIVDGQPITVRSREDVRLVTDKGVILLKTAMIFSIRVLT
jgi:hypothetical protein